MSWPIRFLLLGLPLAAQQIQLQGPTGGVVYDASAQSIRPILGLAGSAHLGGPVLAGLDGAWVAPNGRSALVLQSGQVALIRDLTNPQASMVSLDGAIPRVTRALWSADSSAAVLGTERLIQRISALDSTPLIENPIDLAPRGLISALAADSQARKVVAVTRTLTATRLSLLSEAGETGLLSGVQDPSALAFSQDGQDVYVSDRATSQILVFRGVSNGSAGTPVIQQMPDVIGLATTSNRLLVARPASVEAFDLSTLALSMEYPLDSAPDTIVPVPGSSSYRLTTPQDSSGILWLFDPGAQPSVFFVPTGN